MPFVALVVGRIGAVIARENEFARDGRLVGERWAPVATVGRRVVDQGRGRRIGGRAIVPAVVAAEMDVGQCQVFFRCRRRRRRRADVWVVHARRAGSVQDRQFIEQNVVAARLRARSSGIVFGHLVLSSR